MLHLIPRPVHRAALRVAHWLRHWLRRLFKPHLRGVSVIAADEHGHVLLVRHSYGARDWSLPGGGCARGEAPEEAARRELREELGLELAGLALLGTLEERISGAPHTAYVFAARAYRSPARDDREIIEVGHFRPDRLPDDLSELTHARLALWRTRRDGG